MSMGFSLLQAGGKDDIQFPGETIRECHQFDTEAFCIIR